VDIVDTDGKLVCTNETFAGREIGALTYEFKGNRITRVSSQHHNDYVQAMWELRTGDYDCFGEFNVGVRPALTMLPGQNKIITYYGYGTLRFSLGDNLESDGKYLSSYHQWLFLTDATMKATTAGSYWRRAALRFPDCLSRVRHGASGYGPALRGLQAA